VPESTVNANVYVIIKSCSTFGNTSTPPDEAPLRSGCAHSTFKPAFSNTELILAPATAFISGGTATGLLFCSPAA